MTNWHRDQNSLFERSSVFLTSFCWLKIQVSFACINEETGDNDWEDHFHMKMGEKKDWSKNKTLCNKFILVGL